MKKSLLANSVLFFRGEIFVLSHLNWTVKAKREAFFSVWYFTFLLPMRFFFIRWRRDGNVQKNWRVAAGQIVRCRPVCRMSFLLFGSGLSEGSLKVEKFWTLKRTLKVFEISFEFVECFENQRLFWFQVLFTVVWFWWYFEFEVSW